MHALHVSGIVSEDENVQRVLVKQSYPLKTSGEQSCEAARKNAMEEVSRVVTADGTVIRLLLDGGTQVTVLHSSSRCLLSVCCSVYKRHVFHAR